MSVNGTMKPLDQSTDNGIVTSINKHPNAANKWMSADFQLSYDPCACRYDSKWEFLLTLFQNSSININYRQTDVEIDISKNGKPNYDADFLVNFDNNSEPGSVVYKTMDDLFDDYTSQLEKYKQDLDRYQQYQGDIKKQILGLGKDLVVDGLASAVPGGSVAKWLVEKQLNFGAEAKDIESGILDASKGVFGEGYDYLSAQILGPEPGKPVPPSMPTATISEGVMTGNISVETAVNDVPTIYGMGTYPYGQLGYDFTSSSNQLGTLDEAIYPYYNETPGLFALLKYPTIKYKENYEVRDWRAIIKHITGNIPLSWSINAYNELKIEDIQFTLNPILDIDFNRTKFFVQLQFELDSNRWTTSGPHINLVDPNDELTHQKGIIMKTEMLPLEALETCNIKVFTTRDGLSTVIPRNLYPQGVSAYLQNFLGYEGDLTPKNVVVKIMADIYFNQIGTNGKQVNTTKVFSYPIPQDKVISAPNESFSYEHDFAYQAPVERNYTNENFNYGHPDLIFPDGDAKIIAGTINLSGTITTQYPELIFEYINELTLSSNAEIGPNITIRQYRPTYNAVPIDPIQDNSYLNQYCSSSGAYRANVFGKRAKEDIDRVLEERRRSLQSNKTEASLNVEMWPNPSRGYVNISWNTPQMDGAGILEVKIFSTNGSLVSTELMSSRDGMSELDISALPVGIYTVQIISESGKMWREKLIKH
jgi:hypothetical protein